MDVGLSDLLREQLPGPLPSHRLLELNRGVREAVAEGHDLEELAGEAPSATF
jgi:hypothetical protein